MPRKSKRNASETEITHSDEGELAEGDSVSHPEAEEPQADATMANLQTILQELREFRRENSDTLREIRGDIMATNNRIDEAETRIFETEERVQGLEEAMGELLKLQAKLEDKLTDQEGRARRDNIRIHGIEEGSENGSASMMVFVENLFKEKLELPRDAELGIERAHRALGPKPPPEAPPRSIVVKFSRNKIKEEILQQVWRKKGFLHKEKKVYVDHDYAPETLRKRREYAEAKKVLRENKIRFQTPFPARMRVFYEGETCVYNSAQEATKDMVKRGLPVAIHKPPTSWADRVKNLMWHKTRSIRGGERRPEAQRDGFKKKLDVFRRADS